MHLLEADSITVSFDGRKILSDIYLKVDKGDIVGFLGRNGSGKSTLLKVIFGALKAQSQSIRIEGQYINKAYKTHLIKYLPQTGLFPKFLTVRKAMEIYEADKEFLHKHPEVKEYLNFKFSELSTGMKRFLEILILLYCPGKVILLDEPFSYLSPILAEKLLPILKDASKNKGILLTDHQYESIIEVSNQLYLLWEGSLKSIKDREELQTFGYIR